MITNVELRGSRLFVGLKGCEVECIDADGVQRWALGVLAGVHVAEKYAEFMSAGDHLRIVGAGMIVYRGGRVQSQGFGTVAFESGANPTFQPTSYSEAEVRLRKLLDQTSKSEKRLEQRQRALEALTERDIEVIEPETEEQEPEPEPAPEPAPDPAKTE